LFIFYLLLYSGEEVMSLYKVRQSWLYTTAKRNRIPICRIAGKNYYNKKHVDEFFGMAVDMESITDWLLTEKAEEQFAMQHPPLYVLYPVPSVTQIHNRLTPEQLLPYIIGHSALFVRQSAPKVSDKVP
jgi:hypothetical protein